LVILGREEVGHRLGVIRVEILLEGGL